MAMTTSKAVGIDEVGVDQIRVLFVVWELGPFIKVGGLGDVARSLPLALRELDIDIRIVLPFYDSVNLSGQKAEKVGQFAVVYDGRQAAVTVFKVFLPGSDIAVYLLSNQEYFVRPLRETFAVFDLAVVAMVRKNVLNWEPRIIHCNDTHAGMIPLLVRHTGLPVKTLLTIHNLFHQGRTSYKIAAKMGIPENMCRLIKWETENEERINFLLEGIIHADMVNTVSPNYAREILTPGFGAGLDEFLRGEEGKITGIINGIDTNSRDPSLDERLPYRFALENPSGRNSDAVLNWEEGKKKNKEALRAKIGFEQNEKTPLIGFVGRISENQKGISLIHALLGRVNLDNYQFIILGKGDEEWEERLSWFAKFYPKSVYVCNEFCDRLALQIYASCDFLMIPSKFEPCGLIQMIAMRYGTLPVAHAVGGLKDTITDGVDGFLFDEYTSEALEKAINRAVEIRFHQPQAYHSMVEAAMSRDFSWKHSADKYIAIYTKLLSS